MNSFELNKILGAILGTCLILLALSIAAGAVFAPVKPAKPGFAIAVKEEAGGATQTKKAPEQPIETLLASASADKGKSIAKQCQACHTFEKGGPNRVGPNLWDIVGNERGQGRGGFNFSSAMKSKGGTWTYDELNKFLTNPRGYIPGTAMTFAGLSREEQRADVIAYLRTLSDNPKPLPKAAEAKPAEAKPAAGGQQAPAQGGQPPAENKAAPAPSAPAQNAPAQGSAPAPEKKQ
ncbi:MAG: Cytochrome c, class I precursor [Pseudolabrys sp.]|jgi:cytochrome c|nr:Cytochrome c, class I precursor [Pseudolabrys sp.]